MFPIIFYNQIVEKCGGVPLAIKTIASTLSIKETANEWRSFKDNELARLSQKDGEIMPTLKLSYDHLPFHLKHCFAYCRLYPKYHKINVQTLVQLWIAQGFVKQSDSDGSLEEIGLDYFKGSAEHLSKDLKTQQIQPLWKQIVERCGGVPLVIRTIARTLPVKETVNEWRSFKEAPEECLQVLKLDWCRGIEELPKKIENLVNLTHLPCRDCWSLTHMPRGIGKLNSLQTLSLFVVDILGSHGAGAADLSELGGLNNLRGKLWITILGFVKNAKEEFRPANLKEKQHLRVLYLQLSNYRGYEGEDEDDEEKSLEDLPPQPNLELHGTLLTGLGTIGAQNMNLCLLTDMSSMEDIHSSTADPFHAIYSDAVDILLEDASSREPRRVKPSSGSFEVAHSSKLLEHQIYSKTTSS
ncbi:putative disease resistance protein At3g14460 [Hibiscus syriacus]|uniref:putative disease resistance protein At3g14460 n=1 Tax=Hibiscus syriacus TaxID=106335 RepID=UPI001922C25A|nr:putative disease resistance protein At3g14460 [Hibiscus syriacus]